jgi:hypothetical protein
MAFSDPQSVTIGADTISLPRVSSGSGNGGFSSADGATALTIQNAYGKRIRRTIALTTKKLTSDPLVPSNNVAVNMMGRVILDVPVQGFTPQEQVDALVALFTELTKATNANLLKFVGGEA